MIKGYRRPDGNLGIRNYLAVIPSVICSNEVALRIAAEIPDAVALPHHSGCGVTGEDLERCKRTLIGLGQNPNVGAVLIVGMGCESVGPYELASAIAENGKEVEIVIIQEEGGVTSTIKAGIEKARKMSQRLSQMELVEADEGELTLGLKCGGSDATSGIAANPAVGIAVDLLIKKGGSAMISEITEIIGGEYVLAQKAESKAVKNKLIQTVKKAEKTVKAVVMGDERFLSPGNIRGGLTTLEEKSLGSIRKAGSTSVIDVVEYAENPSKKGLIVMNGTALDIPSMTGMVAGGAQIIVFTTGRGSTVGYPIAPVIKITGNPLTYDKMEEDMDINAGTIVEGKETVEQVGRRIYEEIIAVANGKKTKSETLGLKDFGISSMAGYF